MKKALSLLDRVHLKRALGVHVADDTVHVAVAARTPLGVRLAGQFSAPLAGRTLAVATSEALTRARAAFKRCDEITVGLSENDVYFDAKAVSSNTTPEQYATHESLATLLPPALSPPTLIVNLLPYTPLGRPMYLITACKRTVIYNAIQAFAETGVKANRFEPVPWAVLRCSLLHAPPGPKDTLQMRILVGPRRAMGYLLDGDMPLAWFVASVHEDDRESALLATIRAMETHMLSHFGEKVNTVLLQGTDEEFATLLSLSCGLTVTHVPGPQLDGQAVAFGLAQAALDPMYPAPDLASKVQEPGSILSLVNQWEAGSVAAAVLILGGYLWWTLDDLDVRYRRTRSAVNRVKGAAAKAPPALTKEKDEAVKLARGCSSFLVREVSVARILVHLARSMPEHTKITKITFKNPPPNPNGPPGERQMTLYVIAPEEKPIQMAIRTDPYLKQAFGRVRFTGLGRTGTELLRSFQLVATGSGPAVVEEPPPPSPAPSPAPAPDPIAAPKGVK